MLCLLSARIYSGHTADTRSNTQDKTHLEGVYFRPGVYEFVNTKQKLKYTKKKLLYVREL